MDGEPEWGKDGIEAWAVTGGHGIPFLDTIRANAEDATHRFRRSMCSASMTPPPWAEFEASGYRVMRVRVLPVVDPDEGPIP
jgi:hypothetical protein